MNALKAFSDLRNECAFQLKSSANAKSKINLKLTGTRQAAVSRAASLAEKKNRTAGVNENSPHPLLFSRLFLKYIVIQLSEV